MSTRSGPRFSGASSGSSVSAADPVAHTDCSGSPPTGLPIAENPSLRLGPIKNSQVRTVVNTKQSEVKTNYIHRRTRLDRIFLNSMSSGCDAVREQARSVSGAALFSHLMSCHCVKSFILTWQRKRPRL